MPMETSQALQKSFAPEEGTEPPWLGTGAETPSHPPAARGFAAGKRHFHCLPLPFGEGEGAVWWGKEGSGSAPGLHNAETSMSAQL